MTLGYRIKERRQILRITQKDLANITCVTLQHISAIEQDKRIPSLALLIKLAECLNTSLDYLIIGRTISTDLISAIKDDDALDAGMKESLIHLITVIHDAMKKIKN
jgi:transcriptional regulator with XRE-family HTH domain